MNDNMEQFEKDLRAIRPRGLSAAARDQLLQRLSGPSPTSQWAMPYAGWWAAWLSAAALVLVAVWLGVKYREQPAVPVAPVVAKEIPEQAKPAGQPGLRLVAADTAVVEQKDRGIVMPEQGRPLRMMEYKFMDRVEWEHQTDRRHIQVNRPRYGVVLTGLDVD